MKLTLMKSILTILLTTLSLTLVAAEKKAKSDEDIIVLESNFIGDKEQPSVLYFIPWQGIGTPDKLQWDMTDKIDKTLDRVDRDVFRRSLRIYNEMNLETPNR